MTLNDIKKKKTIKPSCIYLRQYCQQQLHAHTERETEVKNADADQGLKMNNETGDLKFSLCNPLTTDREVKRLS